MDLTLLDISGPNSLLCHIHGDKRMCQKVIHYTTHSLQTIRKSSTQTSNYGLFHLDQSIRSYIIALGIQRTITDKPYRRSRAGQQLFHKIHSKILQKRTMSSTERGLGTQIFNLIQIKLKNTTLTRPNLTISHVNAHSVNNKVGTLQSIITDRNLDICAITETWLKLEEDDLTIKQIPPDGYNIISYPTPNGCMGGGVALIFKDNLWIVDNTNRNTDSMEIHRYQRWWNSYTKQPLSHVS